MQTPFRRSLLVGGTIVAESLKGVYLTLEYLAVKSQSPGSAVALSVPCEEVCPSR